MSVYLVGAGPGDEGLITVKGLGLLRAADVIIYDRLAAKALLGEAKPEARLIFAGKRAGEHSFAQAEINEILVNEGKAAEASGRIVLRLKGGDPFLFGRGAEETEALQAAGLSFEVVPGVTSALAAPAYAGIPLTHRELSSSVAIVSGHNAPGNQEPDWQALAKGVDTLVVLMGLRNLGEITQKIMHGGLPPETPATVVEWGSTGRQRKVVGCLYNIAAKVHKAGIEAPAIFVAGRVAGLGSDPSWFEQKPLFGHKIVVTRAREQAGELAAALRLLGASVIEFPTIKINPVADKSLALRAIDNLRNYSWLVFTSVNGVMEFFKLLDAQGLDSRVLSGLKLAAIGPATAKALAARGVKADFMPAEYIAESLAQGLAERFVPGSGPVLLARAKVTRQVLEKILQERGVPVEVVPVYETGLPQEDSMLWGAHNQLLHDLEQNKIDAIIFCSPSAVDNFFKLVQPEKFADKDVTFACIGPVSSDSLKKYGLSCKVQPEAYSIDDLVDALISFLGASRSKEIK